MPLSDEDRRRIYEEEKVRIETREQLERERAQAGSAGANGQGIPSKAKKKPFEFTKGQLISLGLFTVGFTWFIFSYQPSDFSQDSSQNSSSIESTLKADYPIANSKSDLEKFIHYRVENDADAEQKMIQQGRIVPSQRGQQVYREGIAGIGVSKFRFKGSTAVKYTMTEAFGN